MRRILVIFLGLLISGCTHKGIQPLIFDGQAYSSIPFEYPSSLSTKEVEFILKEIEKETDKKIVSISIEENYMYQVHTCDHTARIKSMCKDIDVYLFGYGKQHFTKFTITPMSFTTIFPDGYIPQKDRVTSEYSEGRYYNVPLRYSQTISKAEIDIVVKEVEKITDLGILWVNKNENEEIEVQTCKSGSRLSFRCDGGESILFDLTSKKVTSQTCCWVQ
ncbi:MAG: hypothetical protein JKX81_11460 [Arenicella sp.]|nr:hypothetical protein [Arenicella sp.]